MSTRTALEAAPHREETNQVLGTQPSNERFALYFGGIGAGVAGINYALTRGHNKAAGNAWRIITNVVMLGIELDAIANNVELGGSCY